MTGTGIKTNGEGQPCATHLNLTRTMEGVKHSPDVALLPYRMPHDGARRRRQYERQNDFKVPFAGKSEAL